MKMTLLKHFHRLFAGLYCWEIVASDEFEGFLIEYLNLPIEGHIAQLYKQILKDDLMFWLQSCIIFPVNNILSKEEAFQLISYLTP